MDDALGDALVVEVRDLLAEDEVLEQRRPAQARLQRVLVVGDRHALVGRQLAARRVDAHAVERPLVGVAAERGFASAGLGRRGALGDGAGGRDRIGVDRPALGRRARRVAVLAYLVLVVGHRLRQRLGAGELALQKIRRSRARPRRAAHRRAGR